MRTLLAVAATAAIAAAPALAQDQYPPGGQQGSVIEGQRDSGVVVDEEQSLEGEDVILDGSELDQEQAEIPGEESGRTGEVETLRSDKMSSPNVRGEPVPEDPTTGIPAPDRSSEGLERERWQ